MKLRLIVILFLLTNAHIYGQSSNNIVTPQGTASPTHQQNIGRIRFSQAAMSATNPDTTKFLNEYTLTNKSNLYVTVFLANSMTNYLHALAPALSADSLVKKGNYQFSFLVDNKLIYQTNLIPGAPYPELLNKETVWTKPLIDNQHEGALWSQSAWNRFMYNGGDAALTDGQHTLEIQFRPYIKNPDVKVGALIASGRLNLIVNRKPVINLSAVTLTVPKPYNGLLVSSESFNYSKIKLLKAQIEADVFKHITSVVALKNGKILIEEYFNGAKRDSLHDVRSVGKTFASTMFGIAKGEGYFKTEQQTLNQFYELDTFKNYTPAKGQVTVKGLLTMSSPFDGNDDESESPGNEENMYPTANWVKFALDLPLNTSRYQNNWHYFTAGVVVLGDIINSRVPGGFEKYADQRLFKPLGITNYKWQYTPQGVASTAGGIRVNALDFAKYGQLYKNGGKWKGKQLIPAEWVAQSFTKHKQIPAKVNEYYGYLFWNKTYQIDGKSYETYYCSGNGGNKIFVFKDQPLVVVITATAYGLAYAHPQVDKMMQEFILPAVL